MAVDNNTIIGDFLLRNTNDAQQLGLASTMSGLARNMQGLFDPCNGDIYNHFVDYLVKVPAFQYTRAQSFENGLKAFVKKVNFGGSVFENQVGWVKERSFDNVDSRILQTYFPEGAQAYHTQNRQGVFPVTVNRDDLRTAFQDEYGLNAFAAQISQAPINSDELQTYDYMKQLIAAYDAETPIYTVHYDSDPTTVDGARLLMADLVAWAQKINVYPSARWNASAASGHAIATFEKPENMVLLLTPEIYGYLKVLGFGMLFNRDEAETQFRIKVMDEFPIPNIFAVLCSEDWFQCYDTEYGMYSFFDADTLNTQYRLHHWQILSTSPFAPIVCFGTRAATVNTTVTQNVTGVEISPASGAVIEPGGELQLGVKLTGTVSPDGVGVEVKPNAVVWSVSAMSGSGDDATAVTLNTRTRVDDDGILHAQKTGLEAGNVLTVTGVTVYVNPSGATSKYTRTITVEVV